MNRIDSAGMARSLVVTMFQDGMVFQAALVAGSASAAAAMGRWVAAIRVATSVGTSAANTLRELVLLDVELVGGAASGSG